MVDEVEKTFINLVVQRATSGCFVQKGLQSAAFSFIASKMCAEVLVPSLSLMTLIHASLRVPTKYCIFSTQHLCPFLTLSPALLFSSSMFISVSGVTSV